MFCFYKKSETGVLGEISRYLDGIYTEGLERTEEPQARATKSLAEVQSSESNMGKLEWSNWRWE